MCCSLCYLQDLLSLPCMRACLCLSGIYLQPLHQLHLGVQEHMYPLCCEGLTSCALKSIEYDSIFSCSELGRGNLLSPEVLQVQLPLIKLVSCLLWIPTCNSRNNRCKHHFTWRNIHSVSEWGDHTTWNKTWCHFTIDLASHPVLLCCHLPGIVNGYRCQSLSSPKLKGLF